MTGPSTEQLLKELGLQLTVTRAMLGTLELDQILFIILSGITHGDGLGFNRAFLFLADEEGRELRASTAVGPADEAEAHRIWEAMKAQALDLHSLLGRYEATAREPQTRLLTQKISGCVVPLTAQPPPLGDNEQDVPVQALIARCAATRAPFHSSSLRAMYPPLDDTGGEPLEFDHLAVVPLLLNDTVLGVILADNVFTDRVVDTQDMRALNMLANLAAISIEKARLHARLKEMAALDGLTGVFNRRHYEMRLDQEIGRAKRNGRGMSLLMLDVDHFKQCNDSHGHECGDKVLKDLAGLLRQRVRAEDLVARYGGEEFVVLLTGGASADEASKVAEKLRAEVAGAGLGGRPKGEITVSIGVACLPSEQLEHAALFNRADQALYQAKQQGRNRVVMAPN
ncbi:MAG TPA: sensor domain-containing diguanylate cyclase, partial [Myxococcota bacterium]|nr:sensor domain-containing diguanylate cyclase [Myxococcota bacterium]